MTTRGRSKQLCHVVAFLTFLCVGCGTTEQTLDDDASSAPPGIVIDAGTGQGCSGGECGDASSPGGPDGGTSSGDTSSIEWGETVDDGSSSITDVGDPLPEPDPDCIEVQVECSTRGLETPTTPADFETLVGSTVECSAISTAGVDLSDANWRWSVERPELSRTPLRSGDQPATSLFVDTPGNYIVRAEAFTGDGTASCVPATAMIEGRTDSDLYVVITWEPVNEPDPSDPAYTQLDLHVLRGSGETCWNDLLNDCHWRNKRPDWGVIGDSSDDPTMEDYHESSNGPRTFTLNQVETTAYGVGVEYWDDWGYGPQRVFAEVYLRGELIHRTTRVLEGEKDFWHVIDLQLPSVALTDHNAIFSTIGEASAECAE